jgi:hypothetical protein
MGEEFLPGSLRAGRPSQEQQAQKGQSDMLHRKLFNYHKDKNLLPLFSL